MNLLTLQIIPRIPGETVSVPHHVRTVTRTQPVHVYKTPHVSGLGVFVSAMLPTVRSSFHDVFMMNRRVVKKYYKGETCRL